MDNLWTCFRKARNDQNTHFLTCQVQNKLYKKHYSSLFWESVLESILDIVFRNRRLVGNLEILDILEYEI